MSKHRHDLWLTVDGKAYKIITFHFNNQYLMVGIEDSKDNWLMFDRPAHLCAFATLSELRRVAKEEIRKLVN